MISQEVQQALCSPFTEPSLRIHPLSGGSQSQAMIGAQCCHISHSEIDPFVSKASKQEMLSL